MYISRSCPRDRIWGVGMGKDRDLWRGQNKLGFILMETCIKYKNELSDWLVDKN
jgi:predicted NAD-dependent protein-ADP-ribosyltransferase YbiA (DUF1768 family)